MNLASDERQEQPDARLRPLSGTDAADRATRAACAGRQDADLADELAAGNGGRRQSPARIPRRPELLQQRLAELDATAVEYAIGRDEMFAFVIDGEHIHVTRLGTRAEIASAAAETLRAREKSGERLRRRGSRRCETRATSCCGRVAAQVTKRRLILIPDDSLHTVPFAMLPWSADKDSPLLIERAELSVMPTTLFVTHPRRRATRASLHRDSS